MLMLDLIGRIISSSGESLPVIDSHKSFWDSNERNYSLSRLELCRACCKSRGAQFDLGDRDGLSDKSDAYQTAPQRPGPFAPCRGKAEPLRTASGRAAMKYPNSSGKFIDSRN